MARTISVEELARIVDEYLQIQGATADMSDVYMRGMYNGMEFIRSVVTHTEPVYMDKDGQLDKEAMDRCPERYI
mgnify:CR=1 FL=1